MPVLQKLDEVSFVVLAFNSMNSASLGGKKNHCQAWRRGAIFESREAVLFHALGTDSYSPFLLAGARKIPSKLLVALKCKVHSEQTSETWNSKALPKRAQKGRTRRK